MNRNKWVTLMLNVIVILTFALSACTPAATPAPTAKPAEPTKAPAAPAPTQPPAAPVSKYKEAPMLAEQVKAGKLPPVDQRLPKNPAVVEAAEIGQYGGIWRRGILGPSDFNGVARVIYDALAGLRASHLLAVDAP